MLGNVTYGNQQEKTCMRKNGHLHLGGNFLKMIKHRAPKGILCFIHWAEIFEIFDGTSKEGWSMQRRMFNLGFLGAGTLEGKVPTLGLGADIGENIENYVRENLE